MKTLINSLLILMLSIIFILVYQNKELSLTFYTLSSNNFVNQNDDLINIYIFSYDYDNLFLHDIFEYQLNYGRFKQKIYKSYTKFLTKLNQNDETLYLFELSFRTDIKEKGLYKGCIINAYYDNKNISLDIGDIQVNDYLNINDISYETIDENTLKINLNNYQNINYIMFDNQRYNHEEENIYRVKLDKYLINHSLIVHDEYNSYLYEFNLTCYSNNLSDYFKYLTESKIYDRD